MKKTLLVTIILVIASTICPAASSQQKTEPNRPTAQELLKKFGQTQDSVQSFMYKTETVDEASFTNPIGKPTYTKTFTSSETRFDGIRFSKRMYDWGINVHAHGREVKKTDAFYRSDLWDGNILFQYQREKPDNYPGNINIIYDKDIIYAKKPDKKLTEIFYLSPYQQIAYRGDNEERIDLYLSKEKNVTVRNKTERIGGSECFVIDARTAYGKFTIWIDPVHGYNIAQEEVQKKGRRP